MIRPWAYLDLQEHDTFRATIAFLTKRMAEQSTIDWALSLNPKKRIERIAIAHLLNNPGGPDLDEPWATAWRLIEESWSRGLLERGDGTSIYGIQKRLRAGERSGTIMSAIVSLVAPHLKVEPIDSWRWRFVKKPRRPQTFKHLLSASLTSGDLIDLDVLELATLTDLQFLKALASALEAAVNHGLDVARRLGWDEQRSFLGLGMLNRVYYTQAGKRAGEEKEPDAYHHGIAPAMKLLHAVVARIADLDADSVQPFLQRWGLGASPVYVRLWAAMSRNSQLTPAEEVGTFLVGLNERKFWDLHVFPEIAELRATRFGDLDEETQRAIAARIQKGPPRDHWPRKADAAKVKNARLYWAVRELKRIAIAGGKLPSTSESWLEARIGQFAELAGMGIEQGFPEGPTVRWAPPNPDDRYNTLEGAARLRALETAFLTRRGGWDDDPAERANDWLRQPERTALVLGDLEAAGNGGDEFPQVWNRFGWAHSPGPSEPASALQRNAQGEAERVLRLLDHVSEQTLSAAIEGVSSWLDSWKRQVVASPLGLPVWLRVWPIAVEATNSRPEKVDDADLSVIARAADDDREHMDIDTLNTPAGKLVGAFLSACPSLAQIPNGFAAGSAARQMRDAVIAANGPSGLIARHRLIEALPYFLRADRPWAEQYLITPLLNDDGASLALWRAIARQTHFTDVLMIIGDAMAERATDHRLGRETRRRLVFSLVIESLHAFRENREAAVLNPRIQQMLRTLDDEVRASAASAVQQFVRELSKKRAEDQNVPSAADLFRCSAAPFFRDVWPQERSLATPGVSGALADLPATSGDAFAEALDAIERFLVPFECWSMIDYGFYGEDGEAGRFSIIDNEAKANALLRLLDLTVGSSEGAVVPHDLTDALDQIQSVAPQLVDSATFRRLSTAARR